MLLKSCKDKDLNKMTNANLAPSLNVYFRNCEDITCQIEVLKNFLKIQQLQNEKLLNKAKQIIDSKKDVEIKDVK